MCYLRHYCIAVCFYAFVAPLWKGNCVQSVGKPIISATNRGFSWEVLPVLCVQCSPTIDGMFLNASVLLFPSLRIIACGACPPLLSVALGVGSIPSIIILLKVIECIDPSLTCVLFMFALAFVLSNAVGVGSIPITAFACKQVPPC